MKRREILLIQFVALLLLGPPSGWAQAGEAESNSVSSAAVAGRKLSAVDAFTIALGKVKGRVNLLDMQGSFRIRRTEAGVWLVQLKDHKDIPPGGLSITVADSGVVTVTIDQGQTDVAAWLSSGKASNPHLCVKMRPEVALRKGLEALKWAPKPLDLRGDTRGKITLSRTRHDEWFLDLYGYHGGPLGGYWINIKDDGRVDISAGL